VPEPAGGSGLVDDGIRVLLVDDSQMNQLVARALIEGLGYRVDVASNGEEAVAAARATRYGAILMDCMMPVMDGYEATARIRRFEGAARHTTIVALTALAMAGDRQKCLSAGMDDYLPKPLDPIALADVLRRWVSAPEQSAEATHRPPADLSATVAGLRRDLGPVAFDLVCDAFLRGLPDMLNDLDRAIGVGDNTAALHLAHRIKANAASFGAARLDELTAQLEEELVAGDDQPGHRLMPLREELARIQATVGRRPSQVRPSRRAAALR
jgi:CheY-like chemotaxis protein/HPt (histidine-containing phosphotransfer) domain-containing protein